MTRLRPRLYYTTCCVHIYGDCTKLYMIRVYNDFTKPRIFHFFLIFWRMCFSCVSYTCYLGLWFEKVRLLGGESARGCIPSTQPSENGSIFMVICGTLACVPFSDAVRDRLCFSMTHMPYRGSCDQSPAVRSDNNADV